MPVRNVTGDERTHARDKSSNLEELNNEFDKVVKFSLTKRGLYTYLKEGLQLNFGGFGVELRMKERRIEESIHVNQLVR